ncbi:MAG TPA: hypothetical protein VF756_18255 [Thermoanaerobaculia bacterium]
MGVVQPEVEYFASGDVQERCKKGSQASPVAYGRDHLSFLQLTEPGEDPPREIVEGLATGGCELPPAFSPGREVGAIVVVDFVPREAFPFPEGELAQARVRYGRNPELCSQDLGRLGGAAQIAGEEPVGSRATPGGRKNSHAPRAAVGERKVQVAHRFAFASFHLSVAD